MRDYEELTSEWEELLEVLRCGQADLDAVKHLIFDTFLEKRSQGRFCFEKQIRAVQVYQSGLSFAVLRLSVRDEKIRLIGVF